MNRIRRRRHTRARRPSDMFVRVDPGITQRGVVTDDVHGWGDGHAVEVPRGDHVPADFGGLAGEFGELPCADEAVGFEVVGPFVAAFGEQLLRP